MALAAFDTTAYDILPPESVPGFVVTTMVEAMDGIAPVFIATNE